MSRRVLLLLCLSALARGARGDSQSDGPPPDYCEVFEIGQSSWTGVRWSMPTVKGVLFDSKFRVEGARGDPAPRRRGGLLDRVAGADHHVQTHGDDSGHHADDD